MATTFESTKLVHVRRTIRVPKITNPVAGLTGDQYAVVLYDFSKLRFWKSPYVYYRIDERHTPNKYEYLLIQCSSRDEQFIYICTKSLLRAYFSKLRFPEITIRFFKFVIEILQ